MFGLTRNLCNGFSPLNPKWAKARPGDLFGPDPRRLRRYTCEFDMDGARLVWYLGLPPYQFGKLQVEPAYSPFGERVFGWWVQSVSSKILNFRVGVEDLDKGRRMTLLESSWYWYAGPYRFRWEFGEITASFSVAKYDERDGSIDEKVKADHRRMKSTVDHFDRIDGANAASLHDRHGLAEGTFYPRFVVDRKLKDLKGARALCSKSTPLGEGQKRFVASNGDSMIAWEEERYVVPLSQHRTLMMAFTLRPAWEAPERWRPRARELIDGIMDSMKFEGPWPGWID